MEKQKKQAFHDILCNVLNAPFPDGTNHCYFEPPSNILLRYPCIIYHQTKNDDRFADNIHYIKNKKYMVTIIDEDPDSKIPDRLEKLLNYYSLDNKYSNDNLTHYVYTIYFSGDRIIET